MPSRTVAAAPARGHRTGRERQAGTVVGVATDPNSDYVVRQMRDAILDTDLALVATINKRLAAVARLRAYKQQHGIPFVDPSREQWMHTYLQGANRGPISAEGLRELFEHVLQLTKSETQEADPSA
jgi:chorismate mutase